MRVSDFGFRISILPTFSRPPPPSTLLNPRSTRVAAPPGAAKAAVADNVCIPVPVHPYLSFHYERLHPYKCVQPSQSQDGPPILLPPAEQKVGTPARVLRSPEMPVPAGMRGC